LRCRLLRHKGQPGRHGENQHHGNHSNFHFITFFLSNFVVLSLAPSGVRISVLCKIGELQGPRTVQGTSNGNSFSSLQRWGSWMFSESQDGKRGNVAARRVLCFDRIRALQRKRRDHNARNGSKCKLIARGILHYRRYNAGHVRAHRATIVRKRKRVRTLRRGRGLGGLSLAWAAAMARRGRFRLVGR
jgi:hypothetical protein